MERPSLSYYLSLKYPMEIRQLSPEEGGVWLASIPSLGKHSFRGTGDTLEEALADLDQTKVLLFEDMYERGEQIPLPPSPDEEEYSGVPGLRMSKFLHRLVAERAKAEGVSINLYLNSVITYGASVDLVIQAVKGEIDPVRRGIADLAASQKLEQRYEFTRSFGKKTSQFAGLYAGKEMQGSA